jgi:hypothetical protein
MLEFSKHKKTMEKEFYNLPLTIESEGNKNDHWTKKRKRKKIQKASIKILICNTKIKPPCTVTLTRIAPRTLDEHDNLRTALKWAVDIVADILIPGLRPGRADGSKDIKWEFKQEYGGVRIYGLKIELQQDQKND